MGRPRRLAGSARAGQRYGDRARHDRPGSAQMVQYLKGEGP